MITAQDVRDRLRAVPFQPFRIVTSSGERYDITHPDSVLPSRRILYVGLYQPQNFDVPDRVASVSVLHITDLQPLPEPSSTDSNS